MTTPAKSYDPVAEYLKTRDCPSHVVKAGLKGLVMSWEKVVHELVFDGYRYGLRDFANDLDRRDILGGALDFLAGVGPVAPTAVEGAASGDPPAARNLVPEAFTARIAAADQRFTDATCRASRCLLDEESRAARGGSAPWWFHRVPRRHRANFARDLAVAGIQLVVEPPPAT